MVVLLQAPTASLKYFFGRLCRFLGKDLRNHDRISVDAIYHSPVARHVIDSQFMAPRPDAGHWPRVRHREYVPSLEAPEQESGLKPSCARERRALNLAMQPGKRLVLATHWRYSMSGLTYMQWPPNPRLERAVMRLRLGDRKSTRLNSSHSPISY